MTCVAVIVTYNRRELLLKNLQMLTMQTKKLDRIIIIDNHGSDNSKEYVEKNFGLTDGWIYYVYMNENTGGAGGFYYGMKYAYEMGSDYIWLMDDDGNPYTKETFGNIFYAAEELKKKNTMLLLNSLVTTDGYTLSFGLWPTIPLNEQRRIVNKKKKIGNYIFERANPFNGTLINREVIEKVGYPRKEFFLSRDETDYLRRCHDNGVLIATVLNSVYCHPASKLKYRRIGKIAVQTYNNLDKEYYFLRNTVFSYKGTHSFRLSILILLRVLTIILYEDKKRSRLLQIPKAISDALNNRMGKREGKR